MGVNKTNYGRDLNQSRSGIFQIISRSFTDVDQFTEFSSYSQTQVIQLSCGSLKSEFLGVQIGDLYFTRIRAN